MLRLRKERRERGWTQRELGEKVGLSKQAINDIEKGRSGPGYRALVQLEDLFGLTHRELLASIPEEDAWKTAECDNNGIQDSKRAQGARMDAGLCSEGDRTEEAGIFAH